MTGFIILLTLYMCESTWESKQGGPKCLQGKNLHIQTGEISRFEDFDYISCEKLPAVGEYKGCEKKAQRGCRFTLKDGSVELSGYTCED